VIFREEDFSEEEFRSVALLVERRAGDCGRNDNGTFAANNDCQEDGGGISGNISPFAKSRTPAAKKEKKKGGGGDKVSRPPAQERVSSLTTKSLFDGSEKLELPKERGAVREETIARALTQRAIAAHGGTPINVDKPVDDSDIEVMSDALADDIQGAYERSGRHAGWYSQDVGDAMEIANGLPGNERISQDPIDKFVFGFGMGILSAQNGVEDNARYADGFYRNWRETGSLIVPEEYSHALGRGIDTGHFKTMQALVDRNGWDEVIKFFSSADRVSTIAEDGKVLLPGFDGFKVSKEHVDTKVPRLAIFGPKIGPFTHAIVNGDYDHLVMDRWTMRQAGAITGTLLKETDPEKARGHAERLLSASSSNRAGSAMWYGLPKAEVVASLKRTLKTGRFEEQDVGWEFVRRVQSAYSKSINPSTGGGYGDKTELNLAANNAFKTKVEMQLAPGNGTVANNVRNIFAKATEKTGASNILEVQALGWVDTQNLWQTLGYRLKKDPNENTFSSAFDALRSGRRPRITSLEEEAERIKSQKAASRRSFEPEFEDDFDTTPLDVFGGEYQSIFDEAVSSEEYREALVERISEQIRKSSSREFRSARSFFKSLATQVHSARADGQPNVTMRSGEARHLLPRIGFDAPIPAELRDSLPESLSHARTLIDLHVTKEGANWWRDNGTDAEVFLDTADHESPQNRAFDAFVRKFFHESRDLPVGSGDGWVSSVDLIKFDELWDELDSEGVWDEYDSEGLEFRSADCGRDEGGKFGPKNDCASGDGPPASLKDAVVRWKGSTSDIGLHVQDEIDGKPVPGSGTGKKLREMAASLLKEVKTNSEPAPTLYRGDDKSPEENSSPLLGWTSNKKVAEHWARVYGGQVYELEGATGLNLKKAVGETFDGGEDEWVVMNTRPKKSSRSADCGRDEGGKFGPKNDCASGDGYRGGHKAPRSDGYSKSADDVTGSWPDDIYSKDAGRLYGHGDPSIDNESAKIIKSLKGKPDETVRIYRAVPSNVDDMINPGDWVSINETYAKQHGESTMGGDYKVVSMTVPARHIFTDGNSIHEWGYDPRPKKKESRSDCEKDEGGRFAKGNDCASSKGSSQQIKKHIASSGGRGELYDLVAKHIGTKKGFFGKSESGLQKPSELSRELGIEAVNAKELDDAHARGSQRDREGIASAIANIAAFNALPDSPRQARYSVDTPRTMQKQYGGTLFSWMTTGAMYNPVSDTIHVTASKPTLGLQKRSHDAGYLSTPDDDHSLFHEHAHRDHYGELRKRFGDPPPSGKDSQDEWANSVLSGVGRSVAEEMKSDRAFAERVIPKISSVSSYAATDPFETIAEYTTAVRLGYMENDPDLDRLCKAAFAPVPKKIARRKK
jgi:hypothetical protein